MKEQNHPPSSHPAEAALAAYRGGELPADDVRQLQDHLADCDDCLDRFLMMAAPVASHDSDRGEIADFETALAWRSMRNRLQQQRQGRLLQTLAVAASFLAIALGISAVKNVDNHNQLAHLSQPRLNVPIHDLDLYAARQGGPQATTTIEVPATAELFTLVLPVDPRRDFADYRVVIHSSEGQQIWSGEGLEVGEFGTGTLALSRSFLPAGAYRVEVRGQKEDGSEKQAAEYSVTLRYP
jgi:hypothetical protein